MAAFNFPNSPSTDDLHTENGVTYKWNGTVWKRQNASYTDATNLNVTGIATFANNVSIGGTLTYEDVKNVDSVGIVTARNGLRVTGGTSTFTGNVSMGSSLMMGDDDTIWFGDGADGYIKSDGTNFSIRGSGTTYLRGPEVKISANGGSGGFWERVRVRADDVWLYYGSDQVRLKTTSDGLELNGDISIADKIVHTGDTNTTIRFPAADTITAETGGAERLRIKSNGFVGIGTDDPSRILHVQDDSNTLLVLDSTDTNADLVQSDTGGSTLIRSSSGELDFFVGGDASSTNATNASKKATIDSSGRLLLGTTTEGYADADDLTIATSAHTGMTIRSGTSNLGTIAFSDATSGASEYTGYVQYNHSNNSMFFGTGTNLRLTIDSSGRLLKSGQTALTSTSLNHPIQVAADAEAQNICIIGRAADDIGEISYYEADKSTRLGELQYRRDHLNFRHRVGDMRFCTAGTTERLRITSTGELIQYANIGAADAAADDLVIGDTTGGVNRGMTIYSNSSQNGSIAFADNNSNFRGAVQYMHNGDRFRFLTGGQETLRLQSGGTDGQCTFFMGGVTNNNNKYGALTLNHYTYNSYNQIDLIKGSSTSGSNLIEIGGSGQSANTSAATTIKFFTAANATTNNGTERFRIASDGKVHFGHHASVGANGYILKEISGDYKFNIFASSSTTTNRIITFNSRSNVEAMRIDANGNLGIKKTSPGASLHIGGPSEIRLDNAADAGNYARIRCFEQSSDNGAHLAFNTGAGEVVRFQNDGKVGIGEDSPTRRLHIASDDDLTTFTGGNYGTLAIENNQWDNGEYTAIDFMYNGSAKAVSRIASKIASSGASLHFGVSNNYGTGITHETLVLDYMGDMKGGINPNASLWDSGSRNGWYYNRAGGSFQTATPSNTGYASWYINKNTGNGGSTDRRYIDFYWNSSQVGRIAENGSGGTSYGTSSDYRRKENLAPITDGITEVKKLKPYRFNFKTCDASKINQGFLAHEAQEVVPHAVSGTKDGMKTDERGDTVPDYQDVDYGQLTPILTAALQEAIAEIETLKAEVAALKSA